MRNTTPRLLGCRGLRHIRPDDGRPDVRRGQKAVAVVDEELEGVVPRVAEVTAVNELHMMTN